MKLEAVQNLLKQRIESSKTGQRPLDHILLCGSHELTQEIFSYVSAQRQVRARIWTAASFHTSGDLAATLTHLKAGSILYIDEIHCLEKAFVPLLCSAMQNFALNLVIGEEPHVKNVRLNLHQFSVLASTTRPTLLSYQLHTLFHTEYPVNL